MSILKYIVSFAMVQGVLLAFFLQTSKYYKSTANNWLSLALILLSVNGIVDIMGSEYAPSSILVEFLLHDLELSFLIYVPLVYFFKVSTTSDSQNKSSFNNYLLLPFIIDTLLNIAIVSYYPIDVIGNHQGIQLFYNVETFICIIFNFYLCYKSYKIIRLYPTKSKKKIWIEKIWQSTLILLIAWLMITVGTYVMQSAFSMIVLSLYIIISIWMFWMIYNGIVNLKLIDDRKDINLQYENNAIQHLKIANANFDKSKGQKVSSTKPNLDTGLIEDHFLKLTDLMNSKALYRNEDLSINDVALQLDMSVGYLAKIIKKATDNNFSTWVNEYRVNEVKAMFCNDNFNHFTTLAIGLEAGFKSKSAFYANFKKSTGETPAKYRKIKS